NFGGDGNGTGVFHSIQEPVCCGDTVVGSLSSLVEKRGGGQNEFATGQQAFWTFGFEEVHPAYRLVIGIRVRGGDECGGGRLKDVQGHKSADCDVLHIRGVTNQPQTQYTVSLFCGVVWGHGEGTSFL